MHVASPTTPHHRLREPPFLIWLHVDAKSSVHLQLQHRGVLGFSLCSCCLVSFDPLQVQILELVLEPFEFGLQTLALDFELGSCFRYAEFLCVELDDARGVRGTRVGSDSLGVLRGNEVMGS